MTCNFAFSSGSRSLVTSLKGLERIGPSTSCIWVMVLSRSEKVEDISSFVKLIFAGKNQGRTGQMSANSNSRWDQFIAGALAGAGTTSILHPLDLLKVRFQVDTSMAKSSQNFLTFRHLVHLAKTRGLYQGFQANLIANVSTWGTYFFIYDTLKHRIQGAHKSSNFFLNSLGYFGASGTAGIVTICITNPLWVVKTRMCLQSPQDPLKYRNVPDALYRIAKQEGIKGLYRGLLPGLFGTTHGAVQFTVYEALKKMCDNFNISQVPPLKFTIC